MAAGIAEIALIHEFAGVFGVDHGLREPVGLVFPAFIPHGQSDFFFSLNDLGIERVLDRLGGLGGEGLALNEVARLNQVLRTAAQVDRFVDQGGRVAVGSRFQRPGQGNVGAADFIQRPLAERFIAGIARHQCGLLGELNRFIQGLRVQPTLGLAKKQIDLAKPVFLISAGAIGTGQLPGLTGIFNLALINSLELLSQDFDLGFGCGRKLGGFAILALFHELASLNQHRLGPRSLFGRILSAASPLISSQFVAHALNGVLGNDAIGRLSDFFSLLLDIASDLDGLMKDLILAFKGGYAEFDICIENPCSQFFAQALAPVPQGHVIWCVGTRAGRGENLFHARKNSLGDIELGRGFADRAHCEAVKLVDNSLLFFQRAQAGLFGLRVRRDHGFPLLSLGEDRIEKPLGLAAQLLQSLDATGQINSRLTGCESLDGAVDGFNLRLRRIAFGFDDQVVRPRNQGWTRGQDRIEVRLVEVRQELILGISQCDKRFPGMNLGSASHGTVKQLLDLREQLIALDFFGLGNALGGSQARRIAGFDRREIIVIVNDQTVDAIVKRFDFDDRLGAMFLCSFIQKFLTHLIDVGQTVLGFALQGPEENLDVGNDLIELLDCRLPFLTVEIALSVALEFDNPLVSDGVLATALVGVHDRDPIVGLAAEESGTAILGAFQEGLGLSRGVLGSGARFAEILLIEILPGGVDLALHGIETVQIEFIGLVETRFLHTTRGLIEPEISKLLATADHADERASKYKRSQEPERQQRTHNEILLLHTTICGGLHVTFRPLTHQL